MQRKAKFACSNCERKMFIFFILVYVEKKIYNRQDTQSQENQVHEFVRHLSYHVLLCRSELKHPSLQCWMVTLYPGVKLVSDIREIGIYLCGVQQVSFLLFIYMYLFLLDWCFTSYIGICFTFKTVDSILVGGNRSVPMGLTHDHPQVVG